MAIDETLLYTFIGQQVKSHRQALKITQDQLAERIGVTRTSVTNIEAGSQKLPLHLLYRICEVLNLNDVASLIPSVSDTVKSVEPEVVEFDGKSAQMPPKTASFVRGILKDFE
jgi:transcriptional regulator with XRE-family HTH domain